MKFTHKKGALFVFSLALCAAMLLSSCVFSPSGRKDDAKDVEEVVADFLESIADGSYEEDDYKSSYTKDKSFAKLKFNDKDAEKLMVLGLEKISYEITDAAGDRDDEEGMCEVTLTAVDLEEILEDMEDGYDFEALEDAIDSKKAPTEEYDIEFELEYDGDDWMITDISDLSDILGTPYTKLSFEPVVPETETQKADLDSAKEAAEELLDAIRFADFKRIEELTGGYYTKQDFLQEDWSTAQQLFEYAFADLSWEIGESSSLDDNAASLSIDFSYADYQDAVLTVFMDTDKMIEVVKPVLLAVVAEDSGLLVYGDYMDAITELVIAALTASPGKSISDFDTIELAFSEDTQSWSVSYIPYAFLPFSDFGYNVDPLYNPTYSVDDSRADEILMAAADELLADGSITQAEYDEYFLGITDVIDDDDGEYTIDSIWSNADEWGWWDYTTADFVTSFGPDTTHIGYVIFFTQTMPGLTITCEWFLDNGTTSVYTEEYTLDEMSDYYETYLSAETVFPKDTYRVVLTLPDGTVLIDESVVVTE
ncbi:MAG: hypothetical protein JW780_03285 [Clostridiales bacterium]|nr:hypothetical protein [Clostridiales bacterium]